jgi:hypothetical protein
LVLEFEPNFKIKKYDGENSNKFQQMALFDCRGVDMVDFSARVSIECTKTGGKKWTDLCFMQDGWVAKGAESGTPFEDIDLTEGEWVEYDEKVE